MPRRARVVTWNGKDIPPELLELPAGRYVVEALDGDPPVLLPEEEAGIEAALEADEYRVGHQRLHHSMQPAVLRTVALVHEDEDFTDRLAGSRLQLVDELVELFVGFLSAPWTKLVNQRAKQARFRLTE